jgi:hypothetical protein
MTGQLNIFDEIIVDNFAGGGGASTGIENRKGNTCTGLNTSDMRAYKREWMRRKRAEQRRRDMEAAGVA